MSGLTSPLSVAPGGSAAFNISFAPASASALPGTLTLLSNAPTSPTSISLNGTGIARVVQLSASPTSLSFGSLATGASASQAITVTNTGNSTVTISQISASGSPFSADSISLPVTLAAGQSTPRTMRVDYIHTGSASEEQFALDAAVLEGEWPGPLDRWIDDTNLGKYQFQVLDIQGAIEQKGDKLVGSVRGDSGDYAFEIAADGAVVLDASKGNTASEEFDQIKHLQIGIVAQGDRIDRPVGAVNIHPHNRVVELEPAIVRPAIGRPAVVMPAQVK